VHVEFNTLPDTLLGSAAHFVVADFIAGHVISLGWALSLIILPRLRLLWLDFFTHAPRSRLHDQALQESRKPKANPGVDPGSNRSYNVK
jgi:hypothetical protein